MSNELNAEVFEKFLSRGLCQGERDGDRACLVAAVNAACGGSVSDIAESACVLPALREFAVRVNDSNHWISAESRSAGLRRLGYLLPGTRHLDGLKFATKLAELTIRRVLPPMLRLIGLLAEADRCEATGDTYAADDAYAAAASSARAADAYAAAAATHSTARAAYAAYAAADAAAAAARAAAARPTGCAADEDRILESVDCAIEAIEYARGAA